jgi:hypothetical protein
METYTVDSLVSRSLMAFPRRGALDCAKAVSWNAHSIMMPPVPAACLNRQGGTANGHAGFTHELFFGGTPP